MGEGDEQAKRTAAAIAELGFRNRGLKYRPGLYVLKNTKAPAMLVECCFVDDKDDVQQYDYKTMASAIVYGITGQRVQEQPETDQAGSDEETPAGDPGKLCRVQVGAYRSRANAEAMQAKLARAGFDAVIIQA